MEKGHVEATADTGSATSQAAGLGSPSSLVMSSWTSGMEEGLEEESERDQEDETPSRASRDTTD